MKLYSRTSSYFLFMVVSSLLWLPTSANANSASLPTCVSASSDTDGDGWGWENNQSCVVTFLSNSNALPGCTDAYSDIDGDGYGWENSQSCVTTVLTPQRKTRQHPTCQSAQSDSDGDGYGWENGSSCIVEADPVNEIPLVVDHPECLTGESDTDNDGWGWENNQSCIITANTVTTIDEPEVPKVAAATDGGLPVCLSTASDPDGTGYGYEFNRSCQVVNGISKTAEDPLFNTEFCESWAEIAYGNFRIQNNTWNRSSVYRDDWFQCIELQQNTAGDPVATWRFNWLDRSEGNQDAVKSYPQVYYGRKNERNFSGTPAQTGLPRPIDDIDRYQIDYAFSTSGDAEFNVALESFFHSSCEAGDDNKQFEMMVWVGVPGEKTPGTQVTTAEINGTTWKVYANPVLSWGYVAFVAEETTPAGKLDWNAFIDWSREYSQGLGLGSMENTCMGAIELGTETFWGELEFRLDRFDITRN